MKPETGAETDERIIFVPEIEAFGGGERLLLVLSKYLHDRRLPHRVVCYYQSIDLASYADWPLKVEQLLPPRNPFKKVWALKRFLRRSRGARKPLLMGIQAALHAGLASPGDYSLVILDTPSLLSKRPAAKTWLSNRLRRVRAGASHSFTRRGIESASVVVASTKYMESEIRALYDVNAVIVYQGVPAPWEQLRTRSVASDGAVRFLSVSRLESNKRIDWILRSLAELERETTPLSRTVHWTLDIVGKGSQHEELKRLAQSLGLSERTVFHGHVSDEELEKLYSRADVFVMPAVQGYGLPALEALMRGVPVVMHTQSGASEILQGTPWVELIHGGNESLTQGLDAMIKRLLDEDLSKCPLPAFPTESDWAESVCRLCNWI